MLDLVRQIAGQQVKELAAGQVCRTENLPEVPHAAGLVLRFFDREFLRSLREMAAEDDHVGPDIADQVGRQVSGQDERCKRPGQQREGDIVLQQLPTGLAPDAFQGLALVRQLYFSGADAFGFQFVQRDAVL